jgi:outer membrane protein TolC
MNRLLARHPRVLLWAATALLLAPSVGRGDGEHTTLQLTLRQTLTMARDHSPSALVAIHRYRTSYWQYVTFKADYRPSFRLSTNPIDWQRSIEMQTLPIGIDAFVPHSQANSNASLELSKVVTFTGGEISLSSELNRLQSLQGEAVTGSPPTSYSATPVQISYNQPLLGFNNYKWNLRIEPRRFTEARQALVEDLENVQANAMSYFFDLSTAQVSLRDALTEAARAETMLTVARRRFSARKAPENDVLQAELTDLNADLRLTRARVDVEWKRQRLGTFLGLGDDPDFDLVPALDVPNPEVNLAMAVAEARRNRPMAMAWDRTLLESERSVAQAHASRGFTTLHASYGLARTSEEFQDAYRGEPRTDQQVSLSVSVPIVDWGRTEARVAVAESQREVTRRQVDQAKADFDRDVFLRVSQFQIQERQLRLAARADSVAERRYKLTRDRYVSGEGDLNSVNIAQTEKDNARRGYLDALRSYWSAYYDVRRATLYDFERGVPIRPPDVSF